MPVKVKRGSPNKKPVQASGQSNVAAGNINAGEEDPANSTAANAAAEEENGNGVDQEAEEIEIPVTSYFQKITKSLVKLLEIPFAMVIPVVAAFTSKYDKLDTIFEKAEKVEAVLDNEAKKGFIINNVVGTSFQAVRKCLILNLSQIQK
jgi:hypothetical protein